MREYEQRFVLEDDFLADRLARLDGGESDLLWGPASLRDYRRISPNEPIGRLPSDVGYGEISAENPTRQREALANLNQDMIYPQRRVDGEGRPARRRPMLVSYDDAGNVYARVLSDDQQRVRWQGRIGTISPRGRRNPRQRGRDAQGEIARLLNSLGHGFRSGDPSHHGADLVRNDNRQLRLPFGQVGAGRRPAGRVQRGRSRRPRHGFAEVDAFLSDTLFGDAEGEGALMEAWLDDFM